MAQPSTSKAPAPVDYRLAWFASAFPLSRLPVVGSEVYYFPHGHSEQCPAPLPAPLASSHHLFPCTVAAVDLFADPKTDEPYATISLLPGPHRDPPTAEPDPDPETTPANASFTYCGKQLTQSDANNGGGFSVPRFCADLVFPRLDFEADPPVQNLQMRDLRGKSWVFRHIYRGTPRRHLLTTGWSKFVNAKLLVAGDTVVFMRRPDGELLIGVRRVPRHSHVIAAGPGPLHNVRARVPPQEVGEAARLAREGMPFTVRYYPRQGAGEFVVPRKEVEEAMRMDWKAGVEVRMKVVNPEDPRRSDSASGIVKAVDSSNIWRMLEIDWDDTSSSSWCESRHVNAWQVQFVGCSPLLKSLIPPPPPRCATGNGDPLLLDLPIPAHVSSTTQQLLPTDPPAAALSAASSEIVNPEDGSPPVEIQMRSIRLFGAILTSPVRTPTAPATSPSVSSHRRRLSTSTDDQDDGSGSRRSCR